MRLRTTNNIPTPHKFASSSNCSFNLIKEKKLNCSSSVIFNNTSVTRNSSRYFSSSHHNMSEVGSRKKSSVYTRTGDKGTTSLFTGERRNKDDDVFHALGATDELNALVGLGREYCEQAGIKTLSNRLEEIQSRLFDVGASVATPLSSGREKKIAKVQFSSKHIDHLEEWIDELDASLPPLKAFILPSGGLSSCQLHIARTVCRRAERFVVVLGREGQVDDVVPRYLNRLSDFFFVAARYAAQQEGKKEKEWHKSEE
eukprot:gb/GECH01010037.1/.p1 GENE.gb/GECH01010037.1/~~gb/GECH01010037.1/.p1  ORF type:complete len:257 (+),score=44.90 gb/GECH01010037.1/:1-771(+)